MQSFKVGDRVKLIEVGPILNSKRKVTAVECGSVGTVTKKRN